MENVISRIRSILAGRSFEIIFLESTKMKKKKPFLLSSCRGKFSVIKKFVYHIKLLA